MNEIEFLRKLGCTATRESVPHVDVSARVMAAVMEKEHGEDRPFAWIAGLAAAGAIPVAIMAVRIWNDWSDPLIQIFDIFGGLTL
jgi:hypothetical protein